MLEDKKLKELQRRVGNYIREGIIKKDKKIKYVDFFLENAQKSLRSAHLLYNVSTNNDLQQATGFRNFDGYLWIINASYYSIFYLARALLESEGIKLKADLSIHALTFDALIHYFYLAGKLQKRLIKLYEEAKEEAAELLGQAKAHNLMEVYMHEKKKRGIFTYEMGVVAIKTKAKTSLDRANKFNEEIRKIMKVSKN